MIPALVMGGLSLAGGLIGSKSSKKAQKEANAIARETLNFNKQRYNDYKKMYGGLEQQLVNDANKGVVADHIKKHVSPFQIPVRFAFECYFGIFE